MTATTLSGRLEETRLNPLYDELSQTKITDRRSLDEELAGLEKLYWGELTVNGQGQKVRSGGFSAGAILFAEFMPSFLFYIVHFLVSIFVKNAADHMQKAFNVCHAIDAVINDFNHYAEAALLASADGFARVRPDAD